MRTWPLVGRTDELAAIETCFRSNAATGMVVAGPAGVGKTRLVREALDAFARSGCRTEWVSATRAAASIPFGAVLGLLPTNWSPRGDSLGILRSAADHVRRWGGRQRVVIAVDDAHLLDDGSATLIAHLSAGGLAFVLLTVRSSEPASDAVVALWKDGTAGRMDLPALPAAAVDRLLDHMLPDGVDGLSRRLLHRAAGGNPLTLSELLRGGIAAGVLRQRYGVWRWEGECRTNTRAAELIADRLRGADARVQPVLELVACGEPLPLSLLERLVDGDVIHAAEDSGMVLVERSGDRLAVRLAHPLYGEVLRSTLPATRARATWRSLAEAALAMPMRRANDALRAAVWQVESGTPSRPDVLRAGARQAVDRSDLALGVRLARAARAAAPGPEADCLLAEILEYRGLSAEAATVLSAEPPPPGPERAQWAIARASTLYWGAGQLAEAEHVLDLAADGPGDDLVEASRAWILMFHGRCAESLSHVRRVLGRPDANVQATIWAAAVGVAAAGFLGLRTEAGEIHARGLPLAEAHRAALPWGIVEMWYAQCLLHLATGDLRQALNVATEGYRAAVEEHAAVVSASWAGFRGLVEVAMGRPASACASLREAISMLEHNDTFRFVRNCMAGLAAAAAHLGDVGDACAWLDRADRLANGANQVFSPWIELHRAWTAAGSGTTTDAVGTAMHAADLARTADVPTVEASARYDVVRLGGPADVRRLEELSRRLGTPLSAALALAAAGYADGDGDALVEAGDAFEGLGHQLLAAEAVAAAGRAYRDAGRRGTAGLYVERAAALRAACEGARTPLLDQDGITGVLTAREREVVLLAARHPSKDIAERLGLSTRTIDNNLARAYAKLGVSGRAQLRALLDSDGTRR